uniref:Secreted protein n=1 Tax=Jaculus jaculus TaxID=51337 RepID=A0A8C5L6T4_JACJA
MRKCHTDGCHRGVHILFCSFFLLPCCMQYCELRTLVCYVVCFCPFPPFTRHSSILPSYAVKERKKKKKKNNNNNKCFAHIKEKARFSQYFFVNGNAEYFVIGLFYSCNESCLS